MNERPDKKTGPARLARAFGSTGRGFAAAWRGEEAFRQECALAAVLVPLGLWLGEDGVERHPLSGIAKELGSAAVFVGFMLLAANWILVLGWRH